MNGLLITLAAINVCFFAHDPSHWFSAGAAVFAFGLALIK